MEGDSEVNYSKCQDLLNFNFHWEGWLFWNQIPEQGCSGEFGQKFTVCTETCLCITDSFSHTAYVETKKRPVHGLHLGPVFYHDLGSNWSYG